MKVDVLGAKIDSVDMSEAIKIIRSFLSTNEVHTVFTPNAEMLMLAKKDPSFMSVLNSSSLLISDGAGVVLGAKILGTPVKEKVAGVDLVTGLFQSDFPLSVFLYGGSPGVAEKAAVNIAYLYKNMTVCGCAHGYHNASYNNEILEQITAASPDLLLVALGVPKQEMWIIENKEALAARVCIGCGGTLDILSGNTKRAPEFFIKHKMEWLYRLIKEPARLGRMLRIPVFLLLCLKKRLFG